MDHLDGYLTTAALDSSIPLSIKAALAVGKKTLNRYYDKTDHSEVFRIAMGTYYSILLFHCTSQCPTVVLHPQHKLEYFKNAGWEQEWIDEAEKIVRAEFERSYKYAEHLQHAPKSVQVRCHLYFTSIPQIDELNSQFHR